MSWCDSLPVPCHTASSPFSASPRLPQCTSPPPWQAISSPRSVLPVGATHTWLLALGDGPRRRWGNKALHSWGWVSPPPKLLYVVPWVFQSRNLNWTVFLPSSWTWRWRRRVDLKRSNFAIYLQGCDGEWAGLFSPLWPNVQHYISPFLSLKE